MRLGVGGTQQERHTGNKVLHTTSSTGGESAGGCDDTATPGASVV